LFGSEKLVLNPKYQCADVNLENWFVKATKKYDGVKEKDSSPE
jgi:hypothetical protein